MVHTEVRQDDSDDTGIAWMPSTSRSGQATKRSVSEAGWIPTTDGLQAAAPIERATTYRYATINGHSLLTRIDGPLPNGKSNSPLDSDVTVIGYDRRRPVGCD